MFLSKTLIFIAYVQDKLNLYSRACGRDESWFKIIRRFMQYSQKILCTYIKTHSYGSEALFDVFWIMVLRILLTFLSIVSQTQSDGSDIMTLFTHT